MKYGIIFDLDGTLWEVTDTTYLSVNEISRKYKINSVSKDTVISCFGLDKENTSLKYYPTLDRDFRLKLMDEIAILNINSLKISGGNIYDGVKDTLELLSKKYDLYIVSNTANYEYIDAFLDGNNVRRYFKDYIAASSISISKSDAIKKIINENKIECAIYVGDTIYDQEASIDASIPFIWARYGFGRNICAEYSINSFSEIINVIENVIKHINNNR